MCIRDRQDGVGALAPADLDSLIDSIDGIQLDVVVQVVGNEPVSYTHLDVYKRQMSISWPEVRRVHASASPSFRAMPIRPLLRMLAYCSSGVRLIRPCLSLIHI